MALEVLRFNPAVQLPLSDYWASIATQLDMNINTSTYPNNIGGQNILISDMVAVKLINLNDCNCGNIELHNLPSLLVLGVFDNTSLTTGPDLREFTTLTTIIFSGNGLTSPPTITGLSALTDFELLSETLLTTAPTLTGLTLLTTVNMTACALTVGAVSGVLTQLDANGAHNGVVDLSGGTNAHPNAGGLTAKTSLEGKGWTVTIN